MQMALLADRVQTVHNIKTPTTEKELRSILGVCEYILQSIENYEEMVRPLTGQAI